MHALASYSGLVVHALSAMDVVKPLTGQGLRHLEMFWDVVMASAPCIVVIDDVHTLLPNTLTTSLQVRVSLYSALLYSRYS